MGSGDFMDRLLNGRSSVFGGMMWMIGLSFLLGLLLGWIPVVGAFIGPIVGGYVGGRRIGQPGPAVLAAILPAFLCGATFLLGAGALAAVAGPLAGLIGAAAGGLFVVIVVLSNLALVAAALAGGLTAQPPRY
jgi:hypothetical protein